MPASCIPIPSLLIRNLPYFGVHATFCFSLCFTDLGTKLAELHLSNDRVTQKPAGNRVGDHCKEYVSQFGFDTATCCGFLPLDNNWNDDWVQFYTTQRIQDQLNRVQQSYNDRVDTLWAELQRKIPKLFPRDMQIIPALLHGDLWQGNAGQVGNEPCVFDCASFYGHSEFDLAIACMFGGFSNDFFRAYHKLIPKAPGFDNRLKFYKLFHYLNHWNHFGSGYRNSSLSIMRELSKI